MVLCMLDHKCFLVCAIRESFYMDHAVPFSIASAHYLLGEVADAMLDIVSASQKEQAWSLAEATRASAESADGEQPVRPLRWSKGEGSLTVLSCAAPTGAANPPTAI